MDNLSFSSDVKEELARIFSNPCCQLAELMAFVRMAGTLKISGGSQRQTFLQMQSVHAPTMRKLYKLLKGQDISPEEIAVKKNNFLKGNRLYMMTVSLEDKRARALLENLGVFGENLKASSRLQEKHPCCKKAYLRGAFLGSGSVSDPKGPYHLEFVTTDKEYATYLSGIINGFGLNSKAVERKNNFMVYLKDGDNIADLLAIMGAHSGLLKFEEVRVLKDMRNRVNRRVNCETANLNKTIDAAMRQIEAIKYLKHHQLFEDLPKNLKEVAELRLEYPALSLQELGNFLTPSLGKSGVSYRLKKIESIADKVKSRKGEGKDNV